MDKAYAYKNSKEILMKSSSGGAFLGICNAFIDFAGVDNQWSVYGVKFDNEFHILHSRATTIDECFEFCGSKYAQSDLNGCFEKVANDLNNGYYVLFTGTPCQIAGVKAYISKAGCSDKTLYTMDIICHGTPKPEFWADYVKYLENKNQSKLKNFSFRHKEKGWKGYPILAEFENGKRYENTFDVSTYMILFRKNLLMRKACFNCKFPGNFQSDITVGDFWGVELCMSEVDTDGGVSLILAHTEKGIGLSEKLNTQGAFFKQTHDESYLKYNHNLKNSTAQPDLYDSFWKDYKEFGIESVLGKYGENNIKGRLKFNTKRFLCDSGLLGVAKKVLKKG